MVNPYESPPDALQSGPEPDVDPRRNASSGLVHQVGILGILLIVHGVLLLAVAAGGLFIAIIAPSALATAQDEAFDQQATATLVMMIYGGMGGLALIVGIVQILSGIRLFRFRSRVFGIVAISMGVVVWLTGVCALSGIPLMIYGFVVLLNRDVIRAFAMIKQGKSKSEVVAFFSE